ncbi:MAG: hypothetical protein ACR2RV_19600 [Verrucomicrobiales bacterium]
MKYFRDLAFVSLIFVASVCEAQEPLDITEFSLTGSEVTLQWRGGAPPV